MPYKLFINNKEVQLENNDTIARTLQVNDIGNLSSRQANFTQNIKVPMTAENMKLFDFLGVAGSQSNFPYQKNLATLISDTGECIVYNGYAVPTSTKDYYDLQIYDGVIDFYKAIENKKITDVGLAEINHIKNLESVIDSW